MVAGSLSKMRSFQSPPHENLPGYKEPPPGCAVWTKVDLHGSRPPGFVNAALEFFNLNDINPDSVKVDEYGKVLFETTDPSGKIYRVSTFDPSITSMKLLTPEGWDHALKGPDFLGALIFDSVESAQRFANALKYAVTLCGGAKAPF